MTWFLGAAAQLNGGPGRDDVHDADVRRPSDVTGRSADADDVIAGSGEAAEAPQRPEPDLLSENGVSWIKLAPS